MFKTLFACSPVRCASDHREETVRKQTYEIERGRPSYNTAIDMNK